MMVISVKVHQHLLHQLLAPLVTGAAPKMRIQAKLPSTHVLQVIKQAQQAMEQGLQWLQPAIFAHRVASVKVLTSQRHLAWLAISVQLALSSLLSSHALQVLIAPVLLLMYLNVKPVLLEISAHKAQAHQDRALLALPVMIYRSTGIVISVPLVRFSTVTPMHVKTAQLITTAHLELFMP